MKYVKQVFTMKNQNKLIFEQKEKDILLPLYCDFISFTNFEKIQCILNWLMDMYYNVIKPLFR